MTKANGVGDSMGKLFLDYQPKQRGRQKGGISRLVREESQGRHILSPWEWRTHAETKRTAERERAELRTVPADSPAGA